MKFDENLTIITSRTRSTKSYILECINSIELIYYFVKRDLVILYKQTVLGPLWYLLQPLITSFVFLIIFNKFAKLSTYEIPGLLFYLIGNISWIFFSSTFTLTSKSLITNAELYKKVYFCRIVMPISNIIVGLTKFIFQFILFLSLYFYYLLKGYSPSINITILLFPIFLIHLSFISLSLGLFISSITVKYRDLIFVLNFGIQLLMFATPVVYSFESIPERFKFFAIINPLMPIFENLRNCLFGNPLIDLKYYIISLIITIILFYVGLKLFIKSEKNFIDVV